MSQWPHAPAHTLDAFGAYIVTAATHHKRPIFASEERLGFLQDTLHEVAKRHAWQLQAWAVFPNHYHFIGAPEQDPSTLPSLIKELHSRTAIFANRLDASPGRKVWFQYWDTHLTIQTSYLARLNYVMQNPVKHRLVTNAQDYPDCSASWFLETAPQSFVGTVWSFGTERVNVPDDF